MYTHENFAEFGLGIGEGKALREELPTVFSMRTVEKLGRAGHSLFDQGQEFRPGLGVLEDADHG